MTETNTTELAAVEAAANLAPLSIKDAVLASFAEAEQTQIALAEKYRECVYDVATTKGMQEAIAARADLRDNGRRVLTQAETRIKGEVNDLKRVMASEVERLVAITKPVEDSIDAQIKAEVTRKAEAKAERERIERERVEKHEAGLAKLRGYGERCRGQSIEDLEKALAALSPLTFGDEWEEFKGQAEAALASSIAQIESELAIAKQRKVDEEHRLANERLAAQLAEQKAELDRQAAELMRQRVAAAVFTFPEPEPGPQVTLETLQVAAADAEQAAFKADLGALQPKPTFTSLVDVNNAAREDVAVEAVLEQPAANTEAPTLKLGDICARLGFTLTAAFVADTLGIEATPGERGAKLYKESDFPLLCDELNAHIQKAKAAAQLAA